MLGIKIQFHHGEQDVSVLKDVSVFAALADSIRRSLLLNLAEKSPKTATQLAREYPITRQGISQTPQHPQ